MSVAAFGLNAREDSELATPRLYYTWSGRGMFRDSYCLPCTLRTHHLVDMRVACAVILLCAGWVDAAALRDNPAFMMVSGISSPAEMCLVVANGMSTSGWIHSCPRRRIISRRWLVHHHSRQCGG